MYSMIQFIAIILLYFKLVLLLFLFLFLRFLRCLRLLFSLSCPPVAARPCAHAVVLVCWCVWCVSGVCPVCCGDVVVRCSVTGSICSKTCGWCSRSRCLWSVALSHSLCLSRSLSVSL